MGTLPRSDDEPRPAAARVLGLVGLLGLACQGPVGVKAPPGESSSGDGGAATSSGDGGAVTSTGEPPPDRVPPEPFVLPEGCGDGVIVPGQYDCFFPVSIDWLEDEVGRSLEIYPLDLDGDGRDEMIAFSGVKNIAVLRWNDVELQLGPLVEGGGGGSSPGRRIETRWDWNGDGRPDVTVNGQVTHPNLWMHPNLGVDGIGERLLVRKSPPVEPPPGFLGARGFALIDVDADGIPELLISTIVDAHEHANSIEDLHA